MSYHGLTSMADRSRLGQPKEGAPRGATRSISLQHLIRRLFGLSKTSAPAMPGQVGAAAADVRSNKRSLSPAQLKKELAAAKLGDMQEEDFSLLQFEEQRNWGNLSRGEGNPSATNAVIKGQDKHEVQEESSNDSDDSRRKWAKEALFPRAQWNPCKDLDPSSLYDGRRRDGRRKLVIPSTLLHRNYHLEQYIDNHTKHGQYETLLPNVLSSSYYGLK